MNWQFINANLILYNLLIIIIIILYIIELANWQAYTPLGILYPFLSEGVLGLLSIYKLSIFTFKFKVLNWHFFSANSCQFKIIPISINKL